MKREDTIVPLLVVLGLLGLVLVLNTCSGDKESNDSLSKFVTEDIFVEI